MPFSLTEQLENARMAALSGEIDTALKMLECLLKKHPGNIDAMRLKGNSMELRVLSYMGSVPLDEIRNELSLIRGCYEEILKIKPDDLMAMKDLADHSKNFGDKAEAIALYKSLIVFLQDEASKGKDVHEELAEALEEYSELSGGGANPPNLLSGTHEN